LHFGGAKLVALLRTEIFVMIYLDHEYVEKSHLIQEIRTFTKLKHLRATKEVAKFKEHQIKSNERFQFLYELEKNV